MVSKQALQKIFDVKQAYKKIMNPQNDLERDKIIDSLFYNIKCIYEEYHNYVPFVSVQKENYPYHVLMPNSNNLYSLEDFLINRAITNIDMINPCHANSYDHRKILNINTKRYDNEREKYSEDFIEKNYQKSILHETGHALYVLDSKNDGAIHSWSENENFTNMISLRDKIKVLKKEFGDKYINLMEESLIEEVPITNHSKLAQNSPFNNHYIDECACEYFATKYSGLYEDKGSYKLLKVTNGSSVYVGVPNHFNRYAVSSNLFYHMDKLVSKRSMFESRFFGSDVAVKEFAEKYSKEINSVWDKKYEPNDKYTDSYERFKYLFETSCRYGMGNGEKKIQEEYLNAYMSVNKIFIEAYKKEFSNNNISKNELLELLNISFLLSPREYDNETKTVKDSEISKWYREQYYSVKQSISPNNSVPVDDDNR